MNRMPIVLVVLLVATGGACSPREVRSPAAAVEYERAGGGDILFTVTREGGSFVYTLHRHEHRPASGTGRIAETEITALLEPIFAGAVNLAGKPEGSGGRLLTGTWTHMRVLPAEGTTNWIQVGNRDLVARLKPLETSVRDSLENRPPPSPTQWRGIYSQTYHQPLTRVIENRAAWEAFWQSVPDAALNHLAQTHPDGWTSAEQADIPAPEVDFDRQIVAAVFLGDRPDGGYGVEFAEPFVTNDVLTIPFREFKSDAAVTLAITQPFLIQVFPRTAARIRIVRADP